MAAITIGRRMASVTRCRALCAGISLMWLMVGTGCVGCGLGFLGRVWGTGYRVCGEGFLGHGFRPHLSPLPQERRHWLFYIERDWEWQGFSWA